MFRSNRDRRPRHSNAVSRGRGKAIFSKIDGTLVRQTPPGDSPFKCPRPAEIHGHTVDTRILRDNYTFALLPWLAKDANENSPIAVAPRNSVTVIVVIIQ